MKRVRINDNFLSEFSDLTDREKSLRGREAVVHVELEDLVVVQVLDEDENAYDVVLYPGEYEAL